MKILTGEEIKRLLPAQQTGVACRTCRETGYFLAHKLEKPDECVYILCPSCGGRRTIPVLIGIG